MTKPTKSILSPDKKTPFTDAEDIEIWTFLWQKTQNTGNGRIRKLDIFCSRNLWNDFKFSGGIKRTHHEYQNRFLHVLAPSLHNVDFDFQIKADLHQGLSIPPRPRFISALRRVGELRLDEDGFIESFKAHKKEENGIGKRGAKAETEPESTPTVSFPTEEPSPDDVQEITFENCLDFSNEDSDFFANDDEQQIQDSRETYTEEIVLEDHSLLTTQDAKKAFSVEEEIEMWMFLLLKVRNPKTAIPVKGKINVNLKFWRSFEPSVNYGRDPQDYFMRYSQVMCHELHKTKFPRQLKLELYYGLGLKVEEMYLSDLQKTADVKIDEQGSIEKYKDRHNGGIVLGYPDCASLDVDPSEYDPESIPVSNNSRKRKMKPSKPTIDNHTSEDDDALEIRLRVPRLGHRRWQRVTEMKRRIMEHYASIDAR